MSFFTSLDTYRAKAIARLQAFASSDIEIAEIVGAISAVETIRTVKPARLISAKTQIDTLVDQYINTEFCDLNDALMSAAKNFIEAGVNADPLLCIKRYINPEFDADQGIININIARKNAIKENQDTKQKTEDEINQEYDNEINKEKGKLKYQYFSTDEKEKIAKVLRGVLETLKADDNDKPQKVEALLKTNEALYGSPKTSKIGLAVTILSLALMFVGIMFMATGFGLPIGMTMQLIAGTLVIGTTTGMMGVGFFHYCKHADSSDVIPKKIREFADNIKTKKA